MMTLHQQPLEIMCDVLHTPPGHIVALDLHCELPASGLSEQLAHRQQRDTLSYAQREALLLDQLLSLE